MSTTPINNSSPSFDPAPYAVSSPSTRPVESHGSTGSHEIPKARLVTGRVLSALAVLFLLFDVSGKLFQPRPVLEAVARAGFPLHLLFGIGILLLVCTVLYAVPRTAVLGAVLLTGFLGGAVESQMVIGSPTFEIVFPILFGILVWAGLFLREPRLSQLMPWRCLDR
ncbi:MAG: DoxX family protein [Terracidiphilus sp.]